MDLLDAAELINDAFKAFDLNGNGLISNQEMARVFQDLDPDTWSNEKVDALIASFDRNKDGAISFAEFVDWICSSRSHQGDVGSFKDKKAHAVARAFLQDDHLMFHAFDVDENCKVCHKELSKILNDLVPNTFCDAEVQLLLAEYDRCEKQGGELTVSEFIGLVCRWTHNAETRQSFHTLSGKMDKSKSAKEIRSIIEAEAADVRAKMLEVSRAEEKAAKAKARADRSKAAEAQKRSQLSTPAGQALLDFLIENPFLAKNSHELHEWVIECKNFIVEGDEEQAMDIVTRMQRHTYTESSVLRAAFTLFDQTGDDSLAFGEVQTMLEYLGFPSTADDVQKLLDAIDRDRDGAMSYREFEVYVGRAGGIGKLFEMRRRELERSFRPHEVATGDVADREQLLAAGFQENAQEYWRLTHSEAELIEVTRLQPCQTQALRHIRQIAAANHEVALPKLRERAKTLGFKEEELWTSLAFCREKATPIVHIKLDVMIPIFEKDVYYRTCFETGTGADGNNLEARARWEKLLFGGAYEDAAPFDRPKYGVMNLMNDFRGVRSVLSYGESYLVMKGVRLRLTGSSCDSCCCHADRLSVLDYYGHVLQECPDNQLEYILKVANGKEATQPSGGSFKEIQIHGEVRFDQHVDRLVAHERHRDEAKTARIEKICEKFGWKLSWMDKDEQWLTKSASPIYKEMHDDDAMLEHINLCSMPAPGENGEESGSLVAEPETVVDVSVKVVHPERGSFILDLTNAIPLSRLMEAFSLRVGWPTRRLRFFLRGLCILPKDTLYSLGFQTGDVIEASDIVEPYDADEFLKEYLPEN